MHNAASFLDQCLGAVAASQYPDFEIIVVDDSSTDNSREMIAKYPVRLIELNGKPHGPAYARNQGAEAATGEIIFFVDADVVIYPDTLTKIANTFTQRPEFDALFGSYDENPGEGDFLSQYKNLFHHFVHQQAREEGGTFWSGCGAIRRKVFLEMGGFDVKMYARPSIEDIELGARLRAAGHRIYVNKDIQAKHLKRWTLKGLIKTDVFDRAIPWTLLILRQRHLPNDLNLTTEQRLSALLLVALLFYLTLSFPLIPFALLLLWIVLFFLIVSSFRFDHGPAIPDMSWTAIAIRLLIILSIVGLAIYGNTIQLLLPLALIFLTILISTMLPNPGKSFRDFLFAAMILVFASGFAVLFFGHSILNGIVISMVLLIIVTLNYSLYRFFVQKRNIIFALAAIPFHFLYYFYSVLAFAIAIGIHFWNAILKSA